MKTKVENIMNKIGLKKFQHLSIGSAIVLILLCELPLILALLGFTVLGARFEYLSNNLLLEVLTFSTIFSGVGLWVYRKFFRKALTQQNS